MLTLYVPDVPEFSPIIAEAARSPAARIHPMTKRYTRIDVDGELVLNRRSMGMKPAVWYSMLAGGINAEILEYGREQVRLIGSNKPR